VHFGDGFGKFNIYGEGVKFDLIFFSFGIE
jgi:hypothetical protein